MKLLRDMQVFWKQATIVAILLVPLLGTAGLLIGDANSRIADAAVKIDGFRYNQPLEEINSGLSEHLASVAAVALGDTEAASDLHAAENHVEEAFNQAETFQRSSDVDFGVTQALRALKEDWQKLKSEGPKLSYAESSQRHDKMFDA